MSKNKIRLTLWFAVRTGCFILFVTAALAKTLSSAPQVAVSCTVHGASTLELAEQGVLTANADRASTIEVRCSGATPYTIGLDGGTSAEAVRKLSGAAAAVDYALGIDAATGNGAETHTVHGRVAQTPPAPGTYTDTVMVTVTY